MAEAARAGTDGSWSRIARRIRVPLGFVFAAFYLWRARPTWWSLVMGGVVAVLGVFLRAMASGHVKKNEELYRQAQQLALNDGLFVPLFFIGEISGVKKSLSFVARACSPRSMFR